MGFLRDCFRGLNELVTLGGMSRLEEAKNKYQISYERYATLHSVATDYEKKAKTCIENIGAALVVVNKVLRKVERLLKRGQYEVLSTTKSPLVALEKIGIFNAQYNSALAVGVGGVAGGSLAVGSWALVGILGSASTGTAISTLSGIAASNATLAWFGGGALAAGGAGMSGGIAVLGGIVAIPMIYLAATSTHKQAKKYEDEKIKIDEGIISLEKHLKNLPALVSATEAKSKEIILLCDHFCIKANSLLKEINPYGQMSMLKKSLLSFFGRPLYSQKELELLEDLNQLTISFIEKFNLKKGSSVKTT